MSPQPPPEVLNNQLLATIERQRRIICNLLIKNEALRARLMHTESRADKPLGRESIRRRLKPEGQTLPFGEMRMPGINEASGARSAQ
jgi:hypothetical protein